MKKGLSYFANYCRDRGIAACFTGDDINTLFFTVRWPLGLSSRTRAGFEKRIREDNPEYAISILYKELRQADRVSVLRLDS